MNKINILAFITNNGVSYHRIQKPLKKLEQLYGNEFSVVYVNPTTVKLEDLPDLRFNKFDFIHFNTIIGLKDDSKVLPYLEACLLKGAKIILDIDDHFDFGRSVLVRKEIADRYSENIPEAISASDYITTTTESYKNILLKLNKNVTVFPNFVDKDDPQYLSNKAPNKLNKNGEKIIRVGLTGSVMHKFDVRVLYGLSLLLKKKGFLNRVQFVLCGFHTNKYCQDYEKILTSDYRIVSREYRHKLEDLSILNIEFNGEPYKRVGWLSIDEYMRVYNEIDILLAPLEDTKFNEAKSQIKYLEAGWMNTLFIGSDVPSYNQFVENGVNGYLCKTSNEFLDAIIYAIENWDGHIKSVIAKAKIDVETNYESHYITKKKRDYFHKCLGKETHSSPLAWMGGIAAP